MIRRGAFGIAFALALSAAHAAVLTPLAATPPPAVAPTPVVPPAGPPPYEDQLLRLSEILGAVHYLRQLCGAKDSEVWREEMQRLLDAERPDAGRHARLVDRFNHGYNTFRSVYLSCTPAAAEATQRYLEEGSKIATNITARYGR